MTKKTWENRIKASCVNAGTYLPIFDDVIATLAAILEKRDEAEAKYKADGSKPIVEYTNKGGATNSVKNPALVLWDDLNKSALAYWRDLGLTPSGLKKINENALSKKKRSPLAEVLKDFD